MDSEVNRYILKNESKGLVPGYPQSMLDILGTCNMAAVHGSSHRLMRGSLLSLISSTMMRDHILPKVDHFMRSYLGQWNELENIDIQDKTKHVCFFTFIFLLLLLFYLLCFFSLCLISYNWMYCFTMSDQFFQILIK